MPWPEEQAERRLKFQRLNRPDMHDPVAIAAGYQCRLCFRNGSWNKFHTFVSNSCIAKVVPGEECRRYAAKRLKPNEHGIQQMPTIDTLINKYIAGIRKASMNELREFAATTTERAERLWLINDDAEARRARRFFATPLPQVPGMGADHGSCQNTVRNHG